MREKEFMMENLYENLNVMEKEVFKKVINQLLGWTFIVNHIYDENKKKDEFVIYHGGVYSPIKGEFFRKIYEAGLNNNVKCNNDEIIQNKSNSTNNKYAGKKCDVEFWHWSDIDIGGFNIFTRLRDNIINQLKPLKMDIATLVDNKSSWQSFDKDYKERLLKLRHMKRYECFFDVIDIMLENNARLEQESLI